MFFTPNNQFGLLKIDENYAYLKTITGGGTGGYKFAFRYSISQSEAIKRKALIVKITVYSKPALLDALSNYSMFGTIDPKTVIDSVLTLMQLTKSAALQESTHVIASWKTDISSVISNDMIAQLRSGAPTSQLSGLTQVSLKLISVNELKLANSVSPFLGLYAHTNMPSTGSANTIDPQALMSDMIFRQGQDPSTIVDLADRSVTPSESLQGVAKNAMRQEHPAAPSTKLLNYFLFNSDSPTVPSHSDQMSDDNQIHVLTAETVEDVELTTEMMIKRFFMNIDGKFTTQLFVKFELLDNTSQIVDSVTKILDVSKHEQMFNIPRIPPNIKAITSELTTKTNLEINQIDIHAGGIKLYKKNIFGSVTDVDDYELIGSYDVRHNEESLLVEVDSPRESPIVYRAIPVGDNGTLGFEFANVVLKPRRTTISRAISLTAFQIDGGVKIEVSKIPQHVSSIAVMARNNTTFERNFRIVNSKFVVIDPDTRASDHITFIDPDVQPDNIYEYVVKLIYSDGNTKIAGHATVDYIRPQPGKVDTKISDLIVSHDNEPNVTFTMKTTIIDSNIDIVNTLLDRQDIKDFFKDDVQREREFLKDIIAHNVQRIDLTTGTRSDFGTITTESFSDFDLRKNQSIEPLQYGHKYRYEVIAMLRAPETMFEKFIKNSVDQVTSKSYTFSPAKFLHPLALSRGLLVTAAGLRSRFSQDAMSHGKIGQQESIDISFDNDSSKIVDASAAISDVKLNIITWKFQGSINEVDHFLIMKDLHGVRSLIGKAHSEFQNGNCQYLHPLTDHDTGQFFYIIIPIFNDYSVGTSVNTNVVVIQ
jgi:hypothetical protein